MKKENINNDDLLSSSPLLSSIEKRNSFNVPENYFDDFALRMQLKTSLQKPASLKYHLKNIFKPVFALSYTLATVVVIGIITFFYFKNTGTESITLTQSEILASADIHSLEEEDLIEHLDVSSLSNEDIIVENTDEYILENDIDFSTLINN